MRKLISLYLSLIVSIILTGAILSAFNTRDFRVGDCIAVKGTSEQRVLNLAKVVIIDKGYYYIKPLESIGIPNRIKIREGNKVFKKVNCPKTI